MENWRTRTAAQAQQAVHRLNYGRRPVTAYECEMVAAKLGLGYKVKYYPPDSGLGLQPCTSLELHRIIMPRLADEAALVELLLHELYEIATFEEVAPPFRYIGNFEEHHRVACIAQKLPSKR